MNRVVNYMRDIKFRAWDTITNKMHNSIEELCFENGILIEVIFKKSWDGIGSCADEVVDWQNADQTILMQYTGLKDKNGVEIYEDDIIQTVLDDGSRFSKFIVKWNVNTASYRMIRYQDDFGFKIDTIVLQNKEVIGNIHEQESHT